ncbi:hypothetical protein HDV05_000517 [Chytridiales sp. JEL 0842]|nr:hypothetical protein HDV05_000517 [Chytridiales sp. JEL 0842]
MPSITVHLKPPIGDKITTTVEVDTTLASFKSRVASLCQFGPNDEVRLVCGGRILKDDNATMSSLNLADGAFINVVKLAKNTAAATAASPQSTTTRGPMNPLGMPDDAVRQMMDNPMVSAMLENPQFMEAVLQMDPRMRRLSEEHPELRRMMSDPSFLRQMSSAMRNPAVMQEMLRNQDRQLSNVEAIPGGMAALSSMYGSMLQEESALETRTSTTDESNRRFAERLGVNVDGQTGGVNQEALPNPWAAPAARQAPTQQPAGAVGSLFGGAGAGMGGMGFNPFAFPPPVTPAAQPPANPSNQPTAPATGATDPNAALMNALLASMTLGSQAPQSNESQQNMYAQRQQQTLALLQQMQQLQAALQGFPQQQPASPFGTGFPAFGGISPLSQPAVPSNPSSATAAAPPAEPPEERFKEQLKNMEEMGFTDKSKNIKALLAAGGNTESAIIYLLESS